MDMNKIPVGEDAPNDVNVLIEIAEGDNAVKYEFDKDSGALLVDRIMPTTMLYPCNYGFIPHTLGYDGDAADVLVLSQGLKLVPGCVIRARPIGMLVMEDQGGMDEKILAVPVDDISLYYKDVKSYTDLPEVKVKQINHFFERYKDLEDGKWTKIKEWKGADEARQFILDTIKHYNDKQAA